MFKQDYKVSKGGKICAQKFDPKKMSKTDQKNRKNGVKSLSWILLLG